MKKILLLCLAILSIFISYNCRDYHVKPDLGAVKLNLPDQPYEYSSLKTPSGTIQLPYEDGSLVNNYKATIGRVLFYDKALSINNSVACASCHLQKNAFADVTPFSVGFEEGKTLRNSMGISNLTDEIGLDTFGTQGKQKSKTWCLLLLHIILKWVLNV
jgi:cytochrome c peroxidase